MTAVRALSLILIISLTMSGSPQQPIVAQKSSALRHAARYGRGTVTDVALSPDGKTLAVDGSAGTWLYDVAALEKRLDKTPRLLVKGTPANITFYPKRDIVEPMANPQLEWDLAPDTGGGGGSGGSSLPTGFGTHLAFSADSTKLLTGAIHGASTVWMWDLKTGQGSPILAYPFTADFNRDGSKIITPDGWWDVATHKTIDPPSGLEHNPIVSPDGKTAAELGQQQITLIDLATLFRRPVKDSANRFVNAAVFSPDSRILAVNFEGDGKTHLFEVNTGNALFALDGILASWSAPSPFSPDGKQIALINHEDNDVWSVKIWDFAAQSLQHTLIVPDEINFVDDVRFSRDSRTIVVTYSAAHSSMGEANNVLKLPIVLWDVGTGKVKKRLTNDNNQLNTRIDYTPQDIALTVDATSVVRLWNISTGTLVATIGGYGGLVQQVAFTPQNKLLVQDGDTFTRTIRLLDLTNGSDQLLMAVFGGDYVISPDGNQFIVSDLYQTYLALVRLQPRQQAIQQTIQLPDHVRADQTKFSPDSRWLAVNTPNAVHVYETDKGTLQATIPTGPSAVNEIAFSPDNTLLALRGPAEVQVWDMAAQRVILHADLPNAQLMEFNPESTLLALVDASSHVNVWEMATGSGQSYTAQCSGVKYIAFVPHTSELMIACDNKQVSTINVMLSNAQQGTPQFTQFSASPDGKLFTFINPDGSAFFLDRVAIWDAISRKPAADVSSLAIAYSPDGKQVAVGSDDGTIDVWQINN